MIKNNVVQGGGVGGTVCTATSIVSSVDPFQDGSLVAKYELDGNALATVGVDGIDSGATYATGQFGQGATFPGIATINTGFLNNNATATYSFWFKSSLGVDEYVFGDADAGGTVYTFTVRFDFSNRFVISIKNGATVFTREAFQMDAYLDGSWHHAVITVDVTAVNIYMDNVLKYTNASTAVFGQSPTRSIFLGAYGDTQSIMYTGSLDQFEIYNRALNSSEVQSLYTQSKYYCDPTPQDYIAFYPLTGTAEDVTGTYNGTESSGLLYVDDATRGAVCNFSDNTSNINIGAFGGTTLTISTWISTTSLATASKIICGDVGTGANAQIGLLIYTNGADIIAYVGNGTTASATTMFPISQLNSGNFNHLRVDVSGTAINAYVNNINVFSGTSTVSYSSPLLVPFLLGSDNASGLGSVIMKLGNTRFYDYVLTTAQATSIYNYELVTRHIPVSDGLVAYYPLHNNSMDNYFNQYDGVDTSVTYDGQSAIFNGSGYITPAAIPLAGSYSFSMWVNIDTLYTNQRVLDIYTSTGRITFMPRGGSFPTLSMGNAFYYLSTFSAGTFHCVQGSYDGATITVYVDGVLDGTLSSTPYSSVAYGQKIGSAYDNTEKLTGNIADFRIYNRAITEEEATTIYNAEKAHFGL